MRFPVDLAHQLLRLETSVSENDSIPDSEDRWLW